MHSVGGILNVLDDSARSFVFPMLDNGYVYLAAARLSLFRSTTDWAMVFETFGFSPRSGFPSLQVTTIGSMICGLKSPADFVTEQAYRTYLAKSVHMHSEFFYPIDSDDWIAADDGECVASDAGELVLRGHSLSMPNPSVYGRAGITLSAPPRIQIFELCRALADMRRDEILATDAERQINLAGDMRRILMLDDWLHPDVVDPECLPSRSETFQQLASVIASGEVGHYAAPASGNTHWSNWPGGGTL